VREQDSPSAGLGNSLLIAHPSLLDPNFRRTVVFTTVHDPVEGAFGLVLNRPCDRPLTELLPDEDLGDIGDTPVFLGGPVGCDQLTFAVLRWLPDEERVECRTHVSLDEARLVSTDEFTSLRAFIGYAGWSGGQLETELGEKAWLVQKPDRDLLDAGKCERLWQTIMREQGPWFRLVADAPDDPSNN
jgi:putative transcriptional regulator